MSQFQLLVSYGDSGPQIKDSWLETPQPAYCSSEGPKSHLEQLLAAQVCTVFLRRRKLQVPVCLVDTAARVHPLVDT